MAIEDIYGLDNFDKVIDNTQSGSKSGMAAEDIYGLNDFSKQMGGTDSPIDPLKEMESERSGLGANTKAAIGESAIELGGTALSYGLEAISNRKDEKAVERMNMVNQTEQDLNEAEEKRQKDAADRIEEANTSLARAREGYYKRQKTFEQEFQEELDKVQKSKDARDKISNMTLDQTMMRQMYDSMKG